MELHFMLVSRFFSRSALMFFATGVLMSFGCSSSKPVTQNSAVSDAYARALKIYEKKDYAGAAISLESLQFTARASALEDDIIFLLAQSYYHSEQYFLASETYTRLLQQMPTSPYASSAQFMLAKSYEQLVPNFELDQQPTHKAIEQFALYLDLYPMVDSTKIADDLKTYSELLKVKPDNLSYKQSYESAKARFARIDTLRYAAKAIPQLKEKLAKNAFSVAHQYIQLKKYKAAGICFDEVINRYSDTSYAKLAWTGKIDVLINRKKWFDARQTLEQYLELFPDRQQEMKGVKEKIAQNLTNS